MNRASGIGLFSGGAGGASKKRDHKLKIIRYIFNPLKHVDAKLHPPGWFELGCGYKFVSATMNTCQATYFFVKRELKL